LFVAFVSLQLCCYFIFAIMGLAAYKARLNDIVSGSVVGRYFHLEGSGHVSRRVKQWSTKLTITAQ
jgi:hypothetical protein